MTARNFSDFQGLVSDFLGSYMEKQKNYSSRTIASYEESFTLFYRFLREVKHINPDRFSLKRFKEGLVSEFLTWLLQVRKNSYSTYNQRLAAMKSFADYISFKKPAFSGQMQEIKKIRSAKAVKKETSYLNIKQTIELISQPDDQDPNGLRHRTLLTFMYETAGRVNEIINLKIQDIGNNGENATITFWGKGDKFRTIPISKDMDKLLKIYLKKERKGAKRTDLIFPNRSGKKMTRSGVLYIIKKYVDQIREDNPDYPDDIHCHSLRKSKATHLLQAGVDITYIRDFLGHKKIDTTLIYAKLANSERDEAILKAAEKIFGPEAVSSNYQPSSELEEILEDFI